MIRIVVAITVFLLMEAPVMADKVSFDADAIGSTPAGWTVAKPAAAVPNGRSRRIQPRPLNRR